eukprot:7323535-Ditylum_brightwellii.AAC.1
MSLSTLCGNFRVQDVEHEKVHERPTILFVPEEESTADLDKVNFTFKVSLNVTDDMKKNVTKNTIAKFKLGNPE